MTAGIGGLLSFMANFFPNVTSKDGKIIIYFSINHNYTSLLMAYGRKNCFFEPLIQPPVRL
jgi:hypothetical protein